MWFTYTYGFQNRALSNGPKDEFIVKHSGGKQMRVATLYMQQTIQDKGLFTNTLNSGSNAKTVSITVYNSCIVRWALEKIIINFPAKIITTLFSQQKRDPEIS